jgi:hypothetical protein
MPTKEGPYSRGDYLDKVQPRRTKSGTVRGAYNYRDDLGKDKITEMKMPDQRSKSYADIIDSNSNEESNFGLSASIKSPRNKR